MAGLDDLIATFMGQTNSALESPVAPWQQELLESVNPEKVKRQNIARALAKASTAMATTPGNFLEGVSAAASTGADAYLTGREGAEEQRMKVQQLLGMQQQKEQDRRLQLLMDAVGVQRNIASDKRADESHRAGLERDRAYTDYYNRRGTDEDGLNANQTRNGKQWIIDNLTRLEGRISNPTSVEYIDDENVRQQRLAREQERLERSIGIRLYDEDSADSPQVAAPGKTDQVDTKNAPKVPDPATNEGILAAPQGAVDFLKANPQYRDQFDRKYGPGAAARILGQ